MKKKYRVQQKKFIFQLVDIIRHSDAYKEYIKNDKKYREYLEYIRKIKMWSITFFDVYNNKQFNRLLRKIDILNDKLFAVKMNLRVNRNKEINYMILQYDSTFTASLGEITFRDDEFLQGVKLSYTQINNNQIVVEFELWCKNFNEERGLSFIENNAKLCKGKPYIGWYKLDSIIEDGSYNDIYRIYDELLTNSLQAKLEEIIVLNYGIQYGLPRCTRLNYPNDIFEKKDLRDIFLSKSYEIDDSEQYLIVDETANEGTEMYLCFTGERCKPLNFIGLFSQFRMEFYYYLFGRIEDFELNKRMNKYFNEAKKRIAQKDYKWFVNKMRYINDNALFFGFEKRSKSIIDGWNAFYGGKEEKIDFTENLYVGKYKEIYSQCIDYFKVLLSLQKDRMVIVVASLTLLATVIGICVTIVTSKSSTLLLLKSLNDLFQDLIK